MKKKSRSKPKSSKKIIKRIKSKKTVSRPSVAYQPQSHIAPSNPAVGFKCPRCGYKAVKLGNIKECPLCIICLRCGNTVRRCRCIEGE